MELCSMLCASLDEGGGGLERMDTCLCMSESLHHSPETITMLLTGCESESRSVMSNSWRPHGLHNPWNSPDQNTGVGSHSLLQGFFLTQGSNPGLWHYRQILYQLSHQGSPYKTFLVLKTQNVSRVKK